MTLSIPVPIFKALMQSEMDPAALQEVPLAATIGSGVLAGMFLELVRVLRLPFRTCLAPLIFGNTGKVGLPLALFAFGEAGPVDAAVIFAVMMMRGFTLGLWLVSGGGFPWRLVREPAMIATPSGGLFPWQGWQTPLWLTHSLELMGQLAIPMMLITLGVAMARLLSGGASGGCSRRWLCALRFVLGCGRGWPCLRAYTRGDGGADRAIRRARSPNFLQAGREIRGRCRCGRLACHRVQAALHRNASAHSRISDLTPGVAPFPP